MHKNNVEKCISLSLENDFFSMKDLRKINIKDVKIVSIFYPKISLGSHELLSTHALIMTASCPEVQL